VLTTEPSTPTTARGGSDHGEAESLHGWSTELTNDNDRRHALDQAFDYRGDVTLTLSRGEQVTGYVFNRRWEDDAPSIELFVAGVAESRRIPCDEIVAIAFSGADAAAGRSWAAWLKRVAEMDHQAGADNRADG
jgi:hypothetical protein